MIRRLPTLLLLIAIAKSAFAGSPQYNRDIRPILADHCFACHGSDKRKAGLRLDQPEIATHPLKSGLTAIVPHRPDQSELIRRILSDDDAERMPPPETDPALSRSQVETLRQWISDGARDQPHWAFIAPTRPDAPKVSDERWVRNPLDRFILARLDAEGLHPSPEADRVTLLRRLSLDLTGLPPTPAEVDAFVADGSPDAYGRQVERLLASPHYGERWARHWLDAARYADSNGYQRDKPRVLWPYRDYVIDAFNHDLPYDRFIIEQIAGDELPGATQDQVVATGFLRSAMMNDEGGADPDEFRLAATIDRVEAIGAGILGLTLQCAQCHSHKYDPLSMDEYYRLLAYLNDGNEAIPLVYTAEGRTKIAEITDSIRVIEDGLRAGTPDWPSRFTAWEAAATMGQPHWVALPIEYAGDEAEHWYARQADLSLLAAPSAPRGTASFTWTSKLPRVTAFRLELLPDPTLPAGGPGWAPEGGCALSEFTIDTASLGAPSRRTRVKLSASGRASLAVDGDESTAWETNPEPWRRDRSRDAVFACDTPITPAPAPFPEPSGTVITFGLVQGQDGPPGEDRANRNLGRFRIAATTDILPERLLPKRIADLLAIKPPRRTKAQVAELFSYWRATEPAFAEANAQIDTLLRAWPPGGTTLAMGYRAEPRETRLLARGDVRFPGKVVTAGVPSFLHALRPDANAEPSRLTLALWLVDRRSPTTARAYMNRVWQAYFGIGIVESSEDLGTQCATPSHPALLDWLACEFMDGHWDIKRMHRLIVTSATYRQSSRVTPELDAADPANRLLARAPRFRVDAEVVRDIALSASGLLNLRIGGRSVMPPAPAFLFRPPVSFAPFPWVEETGDEKYRRAIYTFHRRSSPHPALNAFDAPTGLASCARRWRSNTPLQALTTMNEPLFVDCARALARLSMASGGESGSARITFAFRRVLARVPTDAELEALMDLLRKQHDGGDLTAYTVVARVLLNLDETVSRE